jgi:arylsulfatase A-like enzyme
LIARALWTGALAGAAAGAVDALVSWTRLAQFLSGAGGRLLAAVFTGALAAFALSLVAAALAALAAVLWRHTALGAAVGGLRARHAERRARDPRQALAGVALAVAAVPCVAAALGVAYQIALVTLQRRHHQGLIVTVAVAATAALLVAAIPATFLLGRLVEHGLRRLPARALSHPAAPAIAAGALVAVLAVAGAVAQRRLLAQLPLRPYLALLGWALACVALAPLAGRALRRVPERLRAFVHPAIVVGPLLVALALGESDAVRKAATAHTGLAAPIAGLVQRLFDLDRDRHSSVLGGGDCDDLDRAVHPGALDIPGDGIDQNCLGGDAVSAGARDPRFVAVPDGVPRDASILLVTIDTLRADHVGAYGYPRPTTPAIDALAARGFVFENAWAHAPSTRYSMPAILTGRHPSEIAWDVSVWWPAIRPENVTLAEVLKERGFTTGALFNYHYFDRVRRMDQGFDVYDNSNARLHSGRDPASTRGSSSREQCDAAIRFLEAHAGRRFFLWLHLYDPHYEYEPHPGSPSFGGDKIALYDGEIRWTDDHLARVLARLEQLGLADRTIVAVTGDHGEGFGENGIDFHGYHLYAAQTKIPLVLRVPGLAPRRVTTPVGHVDLLPTLANLAGAPASPEMSGRSLLPFMLGAEEDDRAVYQELSYEGPTERRGLVTRTHHLIHNMIPDGTFELYRVAEDPREERDVWGRDPAGAALAERLAAMIDAAQATGAAVEVLPAPPRPALPARAELGDALRFLGADLPREARAGAEIDAVWYFETLGELDGRWKIFVHVEGPGRFLGDHDPGLARWKPGQVVADRQRLRVGDVPGEYTVYLGAFLGNQRLPVTNAGAHDGGQDRIRVGTLRVR